MIIFILIPRIEHLRCSMMIDWFVYYWQWDFTSEVSSRGNFHQSLSHFLQIVNWFTNAKTVICCLLNWTGASYYHYYFCHYTHVNVTSVSHQHLWFFTLPWVFTFVWKDLHRMRIKCSLLLIWIGLCLLRLSWKVVLIWANNNEAINKRNWKGMFNKD